MSESTKASIWVEWDIAADTEIPVQGYKLYMSNGTGVYFVIYDGKLNPLQRKYQVPGVVTGNQYQFKVSAVNFNGESALSDALTTYACVLPS